MSRPTSGLSHSQSDSVVALPNRGETNNSAVDSNTNGNGVRPSASSATPRQSEANNGQATNGSTASNRPNTNADRGAATNNAGEANIFLPPPVVPTAVDVTGDGEEGTSASEAVELVAELPTPSHGIPRQITFGVAGVGVQTDFAAIEHLNRMQNRADENANSFSSAQQQTATATSNHVGIGETAEELPLFQAVPWLDCTLVCYICIALLMIGVGAIISLVTTTAETQAAQQSSTWSRRWRTALDGTFVCYMIVAVLMIGLGLSVTYLSIEQSSRRAAVAKRRDKNSAQLWIVGPIFVCSGVLVCIKAVTHVYKRMQPDQRPAQRRGAFLTADSRASLRLQQETLPPNYSRALTARVPSNVIVEDELKPADDKSVGDADSFARVTLNFEPDPPTYNEAIETLRRYSVSAARRNLEEVGRDTQNDGRTPLDSSRRAAETLPTQLSTG